MVIASLAILVVACGGRTHAEADASLTDSGPAADSSACADADGDGYGIGAGCRGPDCLDDDRDVHECGCDEAPTGTGCPCAVGEPRPCFEGLEEFAGVGLCQAGLRECQGGRWTACEGQVLPAAEECNFDDDDCDGLVDEGVLSECGDCDQGCELLRFGQGGTPFEPADGAVVQDDGALAIAEDGATTQITILFDESDRAECPLVYGPLDAGAIIPPGAEVSFEVRSGNTAQELERNEWRSILVLPVDIPPARVFGREDRFYWIFVELRITLTAAFDGSSPVLEWLTIGRRYVSCTFQ